MLFYRAALPLSSRTLTFVAGIIRRHRASIGSCWRKLNPGKQALPVPSALRNNGSQPSTIIKLLAVRRVDNERLS